MKDKIAELYDSIQMPPALEQSICMELSHPASKKPRLTARPLAAILAGVLLVLSLSPRIQAAVQNWVEVIFFPEAGITLTRETSPDGSFSQVMAYDTETPPFAEIREGRLWFTRNGETDITDLIREDQPYFYTYEDGKGFIHHLAVGYEGTLENFGIYEFYQEIQEGEAVWINGYGQNFLDPQTEEIYPWVAIVWQTLNVPWPMPG